MKDAYYFPHDANAQNDEKILMLRAKWGWEGYGLYWAIIERLRDAKDYRYSSQALAGLKLGLSIDSSQLEAFIKACYELGLLVEKDGFFWSPSLSRRMADMDETRQRLSTAGRKGGQAKARLQAMLKPGSSSKGKERKEKESIKDTDMSFRPNGAESDPPPNPAMPPKDEERATPEDLVELWNQQAHVNLPRVKVLSERIRNHARARLTEYPDGSFWSGLLARVNKCPLLIGEVNNRNGSKPWRCTFEWIVNETNLSKVLNGNYDPAKR